MRNILCKFCVKFCVRFREGFVEGFVVKVSGKNPGRLSLKRFGVFGCERSWAFTFPNVEFRGPKFQLKKNEEKNMIFFQKKVNDFSGGYFALEL